MLLQTLDFYFPEALRARYEQISEVFESKEQMYWIERVRDKTPKIIEAFRQLGEWGDMTDSELLMMAWDDEVLFFYVLKMQYSFAWLAAKPDAMVPGRYDEFWTWFTMIRSEEPWMIYPVATYEACKHAKTKPPIWRIPYPSDYPENV